MFHLHTFGGTFYLLIDVIRSHIISSWSQACYVAKDDLELLILLPPTPSARNIGSEPHRFAWCRQ